MFAGSDRLGSITANLIGTVFSTALGSEMHRRLTFHAAEQVGWFPAQWEGGGLALVSRWDETADLTVRNCLGGDHRHPRHVSNVIPPSLEGCWRAY